MSLFMPSTQIDPNATILFDFTQEYINIIILLTCLCVFSVDD